MPRSGIAGVITTASARVGVGDCSSSVWHCKRLQGTGAGVQEAKMYRRWCKGLQYICMAAQIPMKHRGGGVRGHDAQVAVQRAMHRRQFRGHCLGQGGGRYQGPWCIGAAWHCKGPRRRARGQDSQAAVRGAAGATITRCVRPVGGPCSVVKDSFKSISSAVVI